MVRRLRSVSCRSRPRAGLRALAALALFAGCAGPPSSVGTLDPTGAGAVRPSLDLPRIAVAPAAVGDARGWTTNALEGSAGAPRPQVPEEGAFRDRHATLLLGMRQADGDWDLDPIDLEDQVALGVEVDVSDAEGHGFEIGLLYANGDDGGDFVDPDLGFVSLDAEADTLEVYAGYRRTFSPDPEVHPYLGVGGTVQRTELELDVDGSLGSGTVDDDDFALGIYLRAGVAFDLGDRFRLGLDYRHVFATDLDLFGEDVRADYDQVLVTLGWAF